MSEIGSFKEADWTNIVRKELAGCKTLVELGASFGNVLMRFKEIPKRHGVEVYAPYLDLWEDEGATCECADARDWVITQPDNSWDGVLMIDIVEHLEKSDGLELIEEAKRVARKVLVIDTPDGFMPQVASDRIHTLSITRPSYPPMLNSAEAHLSGWTADELLGLGFSVMRWVSAPSKHYPEEIHHLFGVFRNQ